jgi:hypothetical protein
MEALVADSSGVNDEPTLCDVAHAVVGVIVVLITIHASVSREDWVYFADDFEWLDLSFLTDGYKAPIIETALPELAEVNVDRLRALV